MIQIKQKKIINIQFLRAVAALGVVFYHTSGHYFAMGGSDRNPLFVFFKNFGFVGVDYFFVISGYIMYVTTKRSSGIKDAVSFLYSRLTRIYLGYWPFFLIMLLMIYLLAPAILNRMDIAESFFLTCTSVRKAIIPITWTLKYQLYFYICFSLFILIAKRNPLRVLTGLIIVIVIVQIIAVFFLEIYSKDNFASSSKLFKFYMSPYCLEFLFGCLVGNYFEKKRINNIKLLVGAFFAIAAVAVFYQNNYILGTLSQGYYMPERVLLFGSLSTISILLLLELEQRGVQLIPRFSLTIGAASYSLFLVHPIFLFVFYRTGLRDFIKNFDNYQNVISIALIALMILYSILHYNFIELPVVNISKKIKNIILPSRSNYGVAIPAPQTDK